MKRPSCPSWIMPAALNIATSTVDADGAYAKAWLKIQMTSV